MVSGGYNRGDMSMNMYNDLVFKKKTMRIDWRKIASVDLDRIAREMDVLVLQENIDHLTFCNIDVELDTRMMDPTYVKLFKMSQFTIEYLMHSQNYLTDVISTIEGQLNKASVETDHYKSTYEKVHKELIDLKKENKKRKKMIETQQGLMNANSSNYHQCSYCSKVFLNVSYLQAHITRRHADIEKSGILGNKQANSEIEKELERIKDRLKNTENDLAQERTARLTGMSNLIMPQKSTAPSSSSHDTAELIKQMDGIKNAELKKQKEEFKKQNDNFKSEMKTLNQKNIAFEKEIRDLQERLGKKSNVGWMKDDVDVEKDTVIKQKQEIEKLNILLEDYEKQVEELKTKWKLKEGTVKKKHAKELNDKDEEIENLKAKLAELQNSISKTDAQLLKRLEELQNQLQEEQKLRAQYETELAELRSRPPPITPRHQTHDPDALNRSLSPAKPIEKPEKPEKPVATEQSKQQRSRPIPPQDTLMSTQEIDTYLPDYCPLTYKAVQKNPQLLTKFREAAIKNFNEELDLLGIDPADKTLSTNDYVQKSNELKVYRRETSEQLPIFDEVRQLFSEIANKYASQKLNASIRSSTGNRVTFKPDLISKQNQLKKQPSSDNHRHNQPHQGYGSGQYSEASSMVSKTMNEESEETDDDVSLSNALESNDDDTEPTKSLVTENLTSNNKRTPSPQKSKPNSSLNQDEISDLESISQLLTDRSGSRRNKNNSMNNGSKPSSKIEENRRKIESQLDRAYAKGSKPSPNAVPVGFQSTASRLGNQGTRNESFSSISDLDDESKRPKSGLKSTLSESSSYWVSETHDSQVPNNQIHKGNEPERPATANSLKTSNFDSDEDTVLN